MKERRLGNEVMFSSLKYLFIVYGITFYYINRYTEILVELKIFPEISINQIKRRYYFSGM